MTTLLLVIAAWIVLDAILVGTWVGVHALLDHWRRPAVVVADVGGRRFVVKNHPSFRRSA